MRMGTLPSLEGLNGSLAVQRPLRRVFRDSAAPWLRTVAPTARRLVQALRRAKPACARVFWTVLALFTSASAVFAMSGIDAAKTLGDLREGARYNAITAIARRGQISSPLSATDGAAILQGTTQHSRSAAIAQLASLFKADLRGAEAVTILGTEATLSEGNRYNAIAVLARGKRFGPSLAEDAVLVLQGVTQHSRAAAIAQIAPYLRPAISGQAIAAVLGGSRLLSEGNRVNAIAALVGSTQSKQPLAASDVASILDGTTQHSRAAAIARLATWIAVGLSGDDAATILGRSGELTEGNRFNAIAALARAGRFRGSLTGDEMTAILQGTTGQSRAAAIAQIASAAMRQIASPSIATTPVPLGGAPSPSTTAGTTPTSVGGPTSADSGASSSRASAEPETCSQFIDTERQFCDLMRAVADELVKAGVNQAKSWAFRKAFVVQFRGLSRSVQINLLSRAFLKPQFTLQPFKKAAMAYINSPSAVPLLLVDIFASAIRDAYSEWAIANYQDAPVAYALVQGYGDQMYVGLMATLTAIATGQPVAGWMEAFYLESEITAFRLAAVGQYWFQLTRERKAAVASIAQLIISATSASFARQQGYLPAGSRVRAFDESAIAASVRETVASSDIPEFDRIARLVYQAQSSKLASAMQSTTFYMTQSLAALALADELDRQRPAGTKYWITAFGSYRETTTTMLTALNLPLK